MNAWLKCVAVLLPEPCRIFIRYLLGALDIKVRVNVPLINYWSNLQSITGLAFHFC